ncbi:hypothetical protein OG524_36440 (plasmid) [Streptomyces sp. NBC_01520]|uniref:hypothetical protein n=1 Tax=Streptomyces sp. NBC_01520 TaxID=2903892 RepID=UPI002F90B031
MARDNNPDFATTLVMLHTAVTNTGNELRDALDKGVEKLQASGQAAQRETAQSVVDELGRMRTNLREARDRLTAGGDMLNSEVSRAVTELRAEMRDVRAAVDNMTPPAPAPVTSEAHAPSYEPAVGDVPAPGPSTFYGTALGAAPVATTTQHGELPPESDQPAIPAQRNGTDSEQPGDAVLPFDLIQQAVRDALAAELAPIGALLAESKDRGTEDASAVRDQLREAVQEVREQLQEARREARLELAALREEAIGLRAGLEQLRSQSDDQEPAAGEVSKEHSELLQQAARVSSVDLLCHRDVWEFITAQAGRHQHFRVPPQVTAEGDERIRAAVSGRSLIALLISLHAVRHTARDGDGDQELAATLYKRIQARLAGLAAHGQPVTITLDDRSSPTSDDASADGVPGSTEEQVADPPAADGDGGNDQQRPHDGTSPS